jgi:hypothetical protein
LPKGQWFARDLHFLLLHFFILLSGLLIGYSIAYTHASSGPIRSAGFPTCRIAGFPAGGPSELRPRSKGSRALGHSNTPQVKNLRYGRQECLRYELAHARADRFRL